MARKTPRRRQALWAGAAAGALSILGAQGALAAPALTPPKAARPNIVVILFDDVALMDLGAYGGEARTPNIDRLARQGARFTGYRTSPLCTPSRAMLLTGLDNHRAGAATIEEILPPEMRNQPGYRLRIEPEVLTIAERLRAEGYRTLMAGKWHLGHGPGELPEGQGFDRSLALDASGADNWAPRSYMPYYTDAPWYSMAAGRPSARLGPRGPGNSVSCQRAPPSMVSRRTPGTGTPCRRTNAGWRPAPWRSTPG